MREKEETGCVFEYMDEDILYGADSCRLRRLSVPRKKTQTVSADRDRFIFDHDLHFLPDHWHYDSSVAEAGEHYLLELLHYQRHSFYPGEHVTIIVMISLSMCCEYDCYSIPHSESIINDVIHGSS